ncbi:MAG: hypothetical protein HQL31_02500 [Planctomycetes bacterium]|nr:hypothetical protein [Planctomycetota bacterium]
MKRYVVSKVVRLRSMALTVWALLYCTSATFAQGLGSKFDPNYNKESDKIAAGVGKQMAPLISIVEYICLLAGIICLGMGFFKLSKREDATWTLIGGIALCSIGTIAIIFIN